MSDPERKGRKGEELRGIILWRGGELGRKDGRSAKNGTSYVK